MRHKFKTSFFLLQVVQNGLEILTYLADRMGHDFKPYISTTIQPTIDRLGEYEPNLFHPFVSYLIILEEESVGVTRDTRDWENFYHCWRRSALVTVRIANNGSRCAGFNQHFSLLHIIFRHLHKHVAVCFYAWSYLDTAMLYRKTLMLEQVSPPINWIIVNRWMSFK